MALVPRMACNVAYAQLMSGLDAEQRDEQRDKLYEDPAAAAAVRALRDA